MIIVAFSPEEFIEKLRSEIDEIEKEMKNFDNVIAPILLYQKKELVKYKLLGFKTKPPEGKKLNDEPPIKLYETLITLTKELELEYSRKVKEFREELESLVSTIELRKEELKDHIFILITHGPKIVGVYIISPRVPGFNELKKSLREVV